MNKTLVKLMIGTAVAVATGGIMSTTSFAQASSNEPPYTVATEATTATTAAGPAAGHEQHEGKRLQELTLQLNLTPDQQAKIKQIFDSTRSQFQTFHKERKANGGKLNEAERAKMKANMEQMHAQIKAVLTPEQL